MYLVAYTEPNGLKSWAKYDDYETAKKVVDNFMDSDAEIYISELLYKRSMEQNFELREILHNIKESINSFFITGRWPK